MLFMAKKVKRVKKAKKAPKKKGRDFVKGRAFVYTVSIEVVEDGDDGTSGLVVETSVSNMGGTGGEVESRIEWKDMDDSAIAGFEGALADCDIVEGVQLFYKFKDVVREWKKLTKALDNINKFGEQFATVELGE